MLLWRFWRGRWRDRKRVEWRRLDIVHPFYNTLFGASWRVADLQIIQHFYTIYITLLVGHIPGARYLQFLSILFSLVYFRGLSFKLYWIYQNWGINGTQKDTSETQKKSPLRKTKRKHRVLLFTSLVMVSIFWLTCFRRLRGKWRFGMTWWNVSSTRICMNI